MNNDIKEKTIEYLQHHPDEHENIQIAINYVKEQIEKDPENYFCQMFEWDNVLTHHQTIKKWILGGFVKYGYRSNKSKMYEFINLEATEKGLIDYKKINFDREIPKYVKDEQTIENLFDSIYGLEDVKQTIRMVMKADKQVHVALWGPPATAKSLFLLELSRLKESYYVVGSSTTKVGLSEILIEYKPRILLIDEIDKLARNSDDLSVLLSLMETGLVVNTKHGNHDFAQLNTKIFAAGNIKNLPSELESRFISLTFKEYDEEEFRKVSVYYLVNGEGVDPDLAEYISRKVYKYSNDVRMARHIARMCENKNEVDTIIKVMRKYNNK